MSLWKIAWRSIQQRAFASTLTGLSMALGVMLVVAVINGYSLLKRTFDTQRSMPYNLIVGAKGGELQLVFNTVYHLSKPVGNVPYSFYLDFVPDNKRTDGKIGLYSQYVETAVPVCMGDYVRSFRAIGTNKSFFTELGPDWYTKFAFTAGGPFENENYFDCVVGSMVAEQTGLGLGAKVNISHGAEEGSKHKDDFTIVGVMAPTGTPIDRGVYVNMEGFYLLDNHARTDRKTGDEPKESAPANATKRKPLPLEQREVTAILLKTSSAFTGEPSATGGMIMDALKREIVGQGVAPVAVITEMFGGYIDPILLFMFTVTIIVVVVSGVSVMVSIYNSMSERQHEIAVMRALGAKRGTVLSIVLLESILLSLGGGLLGWLVGHFGLYLAGPTITAHTGIPVPLLQFAALYELILVIGLIVLATLVGFLPAVTAYRTDVAKALTATP